MKASSIKVSFITKLYVHWNTFFVFKKKSNWGKICDQYWCIYYPMVKTVFIYLQSDRANHRQVLPEGIVYATVKKRNAMLFLFTVGTIYTLKKKIYQSVHPCINSTQLQSVVLYSQITGKSFAKSLSCCWGSWGFIFICCNSDHFAVTMTDCAFSWLYIF